MSFEFSDLQLAQLIPTNQHITEWYDSLVKFFPQYEINTLERVASFISQCSHESGQFKFLEENLNYQAASLMRVWPTRFPTQVVADQYAHKPEMIANRAYSSRMGNGDEASGDGWKYHGRGLIQLTGHDNYRRCAASIGMDIDELPEYLVTYDGAVHGACWFWGDNNLNQYAGDTVTLTKRINGGHHGLAEREANYALAIDVLQG
jgi:putative chitinase